MPCFFSDLKSESDIFRDGHMRKKGVFLEYSVEIALVGREGGNILSVKQNLSLVGGLKSADNAQGGCLAAAGRTEQGHELAALDGQRNAAQYGRSVKFFFQVLQIDQILIQSSSLSPNR